MQLADAKKKFWPVQNITCTPGRTAYIPPQTQIARAGGLRGRGNDVTRPFWSSRSAVGRCSKEEVGMVAVRRGATPLFCVFP